MKNEQLIKLITEYILLAIKDKYECTISLRHKGVDLSIYEDKIGIHNILSLYMSNTDGRYGSIGLSILSAKDESRLGCLFIKWKDVRHVMFIQDGNRVNIVIDHLTINFM